jgi:hypothetical protein
VPIIPSTAPAARGRGRPLLASCALIAALTVTGCGAAGLPSPTGSGGTPFTTPAPSPPGSQETAAAPTATPSTQPGAEPSAEPSLARTARPTEQPGPPAASLVVAGGAPVPGELGSYVWDGTGSDAPWIVPPADRGVRARAPFGVTLVPPLEIDRWEASWARVDGDQPGTPEGGARGDAGPVGVPGPGAVGTWTLQVDVRFANGNHAAWYWRVEVLP